MKSLFKVSLLAATVILAAGCQKEDKATTAPKKEAPAAQQTTKAADAKFKSEDDKISYAIGAYFGHDIEGVLKQSKDLGVDVKINNDLIIKGFKDTFAGKLDMSSKEVQASMKSFGEKYQKLAMEKAQKEAAERQKAAAANEKAGDDFRAKFAKENGVVTTKSGLMYQVLKPGTGAKPKATDTVTVNYKGTLIDGKQFDSSYDRHEPISFPLNRVIKGWTEGVQHMKVGAKYKFVIPPKLAYGSRATPNIPANSTLIFEVELVKIGQEAPKAHAAASTSKASK